MANRKNLLDYIKQNNINADIEKIEAAFDFAEESHIGQYRKSGEDYIIHPVEVTKILIDMKMDTDTIIAGILHDLVEDTFITIADIKYNFGEETAKLVDGVTKLSNLPENKQRQPENIRKMIVSMAQDVRVVILKLADRLHNMRTLKHMQPEKQKRIAEETLTIFAPIAHRLGMAKIKWELEDLSFLYINPEKYKEIMQLVNAKREEREEYTNNLIDSINNEMKVYEIYGEVVGRPKHFYSIYKKMEEYNKQFEELYDLIALRVIVEEKNDCYNVLGIIHNLWKPIQKRFKDYIAMPKSNGYQSIHTTILGPNNQYVEIQIRTREMHYVAEEGIAAHWEYKEKIKNSKANTKRIYSWLKKILELQTETESSEEFIESVTGDLIEEEVFVFSPAGDVIELPLGATPLDFAFHIHTDLGYRCVGAKVNGKIVPLGYQLENSDKIEIITAKNSKGPSKDWIKMVATSSAKSKIKKWFKEQEFENKISEGRIIVEKELLKLGFKFKKADECEELVQYAEKQSFPNFNEFLFNIGIGKITLNGFIQKIKDDLKNVIFDEKGIIDKINQTKKIEKKKNDYGIIIGGIDNIAIRFAKCCTPLPGDDIGGYVTSGKGVVIHRKDCNNYIFLSGNDKNKAIDVKWEENIQNKNKYNFNFIITVINRLGILSEILQLISEHKININSINSQEFIDNGDKKINIKITVEINNKEQYERLIKNIEKIKDVIIIKRI